MTPLTLTQTRNHRMTKQQLLGITGPSSVLVVFRAQLPKDGVATTGTVVCGRPPDSTYLPATTL